MQSRRQLLVCLGLIVLLGLGIFEVFLKPAREMSSNASISSQTLFASKLPDASGQAQALQQWHGKTLVINFWATWCEPCREEMPELSQLHTAYADRNFAVLGIAVEDVAKIVEFNKQSSVSYPLLAGDLDAMRLAEALGNDRGVLPYTAIIDHQGNVVRTYFGRINRALLERDLMPLLTKP